MEKNLIVKLHKSFEDYMHTDENGIEYWLARELQELLEYTQWRNFEKVVLKAQEACKNSGHEVFEHFADVSKTSEMPNGGKKYIKDYKLTRYACYLIAQNAKKTKQIKNKGD